MSSTDPDLDCEPFQCRLMDSLLALFAHSKRFLGQVLLFLVATLLIPLTLHMVFFSVMLHHFAGSDCGFFCVAFRGHSSRPLTIITTGHIICTSSWTQSSSRYSIFESCLRRGAVA